MATLAPFGFWQSLDNNGDPLSGGLLYTYEAGTSTNKVTYTTPDEATANANPIVLDAAGRADIWLDSGAYKFELRDSADVLIKTVDNIVGEASNVFGGTWQEITTNTNITTAFENNVLRCTAVLTLSLLPASEAGEGFIFTVRNESAGDVTIDPDSAELINGAATYILPTGNAVTIGCDGTSWYTISNPLLDDSVTNAKLDNTGDFDMSTLGLSGNALKFADSGFTNTLDTNTLGNDRTISLPNSSGTIALTSSIRVPTVEQATTTTVQSSFNNTTHTDVTGITDTITPQDSSSRIIVNISISLTQDGSDAIPSYFRIMRDINGGGFTDITGDAVLTSDDDQGGQPQMVSFRYMDAPATSDIVTYKMQARVTNSGSSLLFQPGSTLSVILLEEILG